MTINTSPLGFASSLSLSLSAGNDALISVDALDVSGCNPEVVGTTNDLTPLWMGLTGLVVCGLFGLNRYRQRVHEEQDRKIITSILADGKSLRAIDIVKSSVGGKIPLSSSSIFVTLTKMEDDGLVESWERAPYGNISQSRGERLFRLKGRGGEASLQKPPKFRKTIR